MLREAAKAIPCWKAEKEAEVSRPLQFKVLAHNSLPSPQPYPPYQWPANR
jgi:hypothetical protein